MRDHSGRPNRLGGRRRGGVTRTYGAGWKGSSRNLGLTPHGGSPTLAEPADGALGAALDKRELRAAVRARPDEVPIRHARLDRPRPRPRPPLGSARARVVPPEP